MSQRINSKPPEQTVDVTPELPVKSSGRFGSSRNSTDSLNPFNKLAPASQLQQEKVVNHGQELVMRAQDRQSKHTNYASQPDISLAQLTPDNNTMLNPSSSRPDDATAANPQYSTPESQLLAFQDHDQTPQTSKKASGSAYDTLSASLEATNVTSLNDGEASPSSTASKHA